MQFELRAVESDDTNALLSMLSDEHQMFAGKHYIALITRIKQGPKPTTSGSTQAR